MQDEILQLLRDKWDLILPDVPRPRSLSTVMQSRSRIVFFVFDGDGRGEYPLVMIKLGRGPKHNARKQDYVLRIRELREFLNPDLSATIPHVVLLGKVYGINCIAETFVSGESIYLPGRRPRLERVQADVRAVAEWLASFHRQTTIGHWSLNVPSLEEAILDPLSPYMALCDDSERVRQFRDEAVVRSVAKPLRKAWRYGDSNPTNFLLKGNHVTGAFDLSHCKPARWHVHDWFHFVFYYAFYHVRIINRRSDFGIENAREALKILLVPAKEPVAEVLQSETERFMALFDLEELYPWLFASFLARLGYHREWDLRELLTLGLPYLMERAGL